MSLKKRRKNAKTVIRSKVELICSKCRFRLLISSSDVESLVCGDCFAKEIYRSELKINPPKIKTKEKYPRGWHLRKKFIDPNGKIFSFGKEIGDN